MNFHSDRRHPPITAGKNARAMKMPETHKRSLMRAYPTRRWSRHGKVRHGVLLWLLGVPIPLILLFFLIRGCVV